VGVMLFETMAMNGGPWVPKPNNNVLLNMICLALLLQVDIMWNLSLLKHLRNNVWHCVVCEIGLVPNWIMFEIILKSIIRFQ